MVYHMSETVTYNITVGRATTVHTPLVVNGDVLGAKCAWYGSTGPKKWTYRTARPLTCKKCLKAAEEAAALVTP